MASKNEDEDIDDVAKGQWVLICKESIVNECNKPNIVKLKHPRTEMPGTFVLCADNSKIYEMSSYKEKCSSWFIDSTIHRDGTLFMTTSMDPLFLILPYLLQASKEDSQLKPLDQLLTDTDYPECGRLASCVNMEQLRLIAEVRGDEDLLACLYSPNSTKSWLKSKVEKVAAKLEENKQYVKSGTSASIFIRSKSTEAKRDDYLSYAHGVISDYLPVRVSEDLREYLGIPKAEEKTGEGPPTKRVKTEAGGPLEDYSQGDNHTENKRVTKLTPAQKRLEKVDKTGMKNISSFFSPKPKK